MGIFRQYRFFQTAAVALFISAIGAGQAHAQIKHLDYTTMDSQFPSQAPSNFYMDGNSIANQLNPGMSKFIGKAPNMDKFLPQKSATLSHGNLTMSNSPDNGKMDNSPDLQKMFPRSGNLPQKMYPQPGTRDPTMSPDSGKYSNLNGYTDENRLDSHISGPSKFTDSFTYHPTQDQNQMSQVGRELSYQDLNRYQFQGSHSGDPGLSYVQAGGNTSQPTYTNSNLANTPATFDGAALQAGKVRSGTSNQLNLLTPNGSRPYSGMQGGSSNINLAGTSKSASADNSVTPGYDTVWSKAQGNGASTGTKSLAPGATMMPSGDYKPTTQSGAQIPMHFGEPRMIIQVQKGGLVKIDDTPDTPPSQ